MIVRLVIDVAAIEEAVRKARDAAPELAARLEAIRDGRG